MASAKRRKKQRAAGPVVMEAPKPAAPPVKSPGRGQSPLPLPSVRQEWRLVGAVVAVTFLAFLNALDGQFIYDDQFQVLKNPTLQSLSSIPQMFTQSVWQFMSQASQEPVGSYFRPVFNVALILNYQFFGYEVLGWHLFSLLLQVAATLLVYLLARQWSLSPEVSAVAAMIFGLHPVHSESISWVSGLPDPLAAVFILLSLLLYERYYHGSGGRPRLLGFSIGLALLAMLSKEVAVVLPIFLILRECLDISPEESLADVGAKLARRTIPFVAIAILYVAWRYGVLGFLSKPEPKAVGIPAVQVFLTIPSILLSYARMLFFPTPLAIIYDHPYIEKAADPRFWGSLLALASSLMVATWLVRSSPAGRRALLLLGLFLLPVLNLKAFNPDESLLHDRYLYLPSVGFALLMGLSVAWISARFRSRQRSAFAIAAVLSGTILFGLTVYQNGFWKDDLAMASHAMTLAPRRPFLLNYVGAYYKQQGNRQEAERCYLEALKENPNFYDACSNLADVYREQGKYSQAERYYLKAIEAGAPYASNYYNLGVTYTSLGRPADAESPLRRALEIQPTDTMARYNLGWVYDNQGKAALAEQAYAETLRINPAYPEPRINLAVLMTKQGRYKEALEQLQFAQRYSPSHPILLYALADVYMKTNRHKDAIDPLTQLATKEPQHRLVHTSLGLCYETVGDLPRAKAEYQRAIELAAQEPFTNLAREHLAKLP